MVSGGSEGWILRLIGVAGALPFALLLALTFAAPIHVERAARGFIQSEIENRVARRLPALGAVAGDARVRGWSAELARRHETEAADIRARLASGVHAEIAAGIARMQDRECECRGRLLQRLDSEATRRLSMLERAAPQIRDLIEGNYAEIAVALLRDLRIFAGANLLAFLSLTGLSVLRPDRTRALLVPGVLLGLAAIVASAFYLFGQNWFFTLLYADYVGLAYGLWLLVVFALLCDLALFRARVTRALLDAAASALAKMVPC
ncbi:MAG: hypothetical protein ACK4K7_13570 [Allosphingosinicella sp.]|uniref:hypothetical protein n=1 Tax=Allosphingosinicella sp. TaxID=2823234 RepID=UPI003939E2EA